MHNSVSACVCACVKEGVGRLHFPSCVTLPCGLTLVRRCRRMTTPQVPVSLFHFTLGSFPDTCILSSVCSEDLVCIWKLLPLTRDWYRLGAEPGFENSYEHLSPEMVFEMENMQLAALGEAHRNGRDLRGYHSSTVDAAFLAHLESTWIWSACVLVCISLS